jgi:hypothetical protein
VPRGVVTACEAWDAWLDTEDEKFVDAAMGEEWRGFIKVVALSRERLEALRYSMFLKCTNAGGWDALGKQTPAT